jgi:2-C-methyl-D-erythritol 4-phosphate cytidylyltransferase
MILMTNQYKIAIVIVAAGSSTRTQSSTKKEYLRYKKGTVLSSVVNSFLDCCIPYISNFIITIPKNDYENAKKAVYRDEETVLLAYKMKTEQDVSLDFVEGGETRQSSVFNALDKIYKSGCNPDIVLIHDGARPFVSKQIIQNVIESIHITGAVAPGIIPTDTQKQIEENGIIVNHLTRNTLRAIQTPQGFLFEKLYEAHKKAKADNIEYTDDTEIWGKYVGDVRVVDGDVKNIKITYPKDLEFLEVK